MRIRELLQGIASVKFDEDVCGISSDSRKIKKGYLFACLSESSKAFIPDAIKAGASFIIADSCSNQNDSRFICYPEPRKIYYILAHRFYDNNQPEFVTAVTGTNGKTSTVDFCRQLQTLLGNKSASIGTLGTFVDNKLLIKNSLTTPDAMELHCICKELCQYSVKYLYLEASSHGIDQYRLHGVKLQSAAFTNLSHDHTDYHADMGQYFLAKKKLFSEILPEQKNIILNIDSPQYADLLEVAKNRKHQVVTYGKNLGDIHILHVSPTADGQEIKIKIYDEIYECFFPILGEFQLSNLLCALACVIASGVSYKEFPINKLKAPSGRMEKIGSFVVVDYAHTPDALEKALQSLSYHSNKKIILVFGCGGNRDKTKRGKMGEVAQKYAHQVIITDDNPRNEDPQQIRDDILESCENAIEIPYRKDAIEFAINSAIHNDSIVLIAGKGHEKVQIIGNKVIDFDDVEVAKEYLNKMKVMQ